MKFRIVETNKGYDVRRFDRSIMGLPRRWIFIEFFFFEHRAKCFLERIAQGNLDKYGKDKEKVILEVDIAGD